MTQEPRISALSVDDHWIDDDTIWSFGESDMVLSLLRTINMTCIQPGQSYGLTLLARNDAENLAGAVLLHAAPHQNISRRQLQALADATCRLIRPSRYADALGARPGRRSEVWHRFFGWEEASGHERIEALALIPEIARDLGRTEEGIEAALDELTKWNTAQDDPMASAEVA